VCNIMIFGNGSRGERRGSAACKPVSERAAAFHSAFGGELEKFTLRHAIFQTSEREHLRFELHIEEIARF
jgi:hypothetical protein